VHEPLEKEKLPKVPQRGAFLGYVTIVVPIHEGIWAP